MTNLLRGYQSQLSGRFLSGILYGTGSVEHYGSLDAGFLQKVTNRHGKPPKEGGKEKRSLHQQKTEGVKLAETADLRFSESIGGRE